MARDDATLDDLQQALAAGDMEQVRRTLLSLSAEEEAQLREELGADLTERSKRQARRVVRGVKRGRVIVVHGIMGAMLDVVDARGSSERVWLSYTRLCTGRIADLELGADEQPKKPNIRVKTAGLDRGTYLPLLLELDREWEVLPFAYDWREDIERSADHLAAEVRRFGRGEPLHLIAHSMGGLVSRCMILRHPELWKAMADPNGFASGGRLVMLGTPNHGSFAIPLMLCGEEFLVRALALLDTEHDKRGLLRILSSFPGAYQMLPSRFVALGDEHDALYEPASWGSLSVMPELIKRADSFHAKLRDVVDPERFLFVAGYNQKTPVQIDVQTPGRFAFKKTFDGDGRVPHALAMLDGVRVQWIEEKHGNLPKNERVLRGVHELLARGVTDQLEHALPILRRGPEEDAWVPASEVDDRPPPPAASRRGDAEPSPVEKRAYERLIVRDYAGERREGLARPPRGGSDRNRRPTLKLEVVWGDITRVDADAYAVGHYEGVTPQRAERALDEKVSSNEAQLVITDHTRRGALRGALGDVNYFRWADPKLSHRVVAVAGMGRPGSFGLGSLRRLVRELVVSLSSLPNVKTVCSVLIGSGKGTLSISDAVLGLIDGIVEALSQAPVRGSLETLRIVEQEHARALTIFEAVKERCRELGRELTVIGPSFVEGDGRAVSREEALGRWCDQSRRALAGRAPAALRKAADSLLDQIHDAEVRKQVKAALLDGSAAPRAETHACVPTRISASEDGAVIRVAAITDSTTVAERTTSFDLRRVNEIAALVNDPDADLQDGWPSLLLQLLLPRDFREHIESACALVFEVDRFTARIHWEVVAQRLAASFARSESGLASALALAVPVARQLRTTYSPPPTTPTESAGPARALIVGDPGAGEYGLPGARREALAVWELLRKREVDVRALIGAPSNRAGLPAGCEPASWFATMEALREPWDILHYCGHGDFLPEDPENAGWVFENGLLTAGDIRHLDSAPRLVVANACLTARTSSAVLPADPKRRWDREAGLLPTLADEFFKLGVRNYVGASWEVDDLGAIEFAESFYGDRKVGVLGGDSVGKALLATRRRLWEGRRQLGKLWAAYQHYGDPTTTLRPESGEADARAEAPRSRVKRRKSSRKK